MIFWVKTHVKTALHYDVIKYFLSKICGRKVKKKFNQLTRRRILLMLLISTVETHCINVFSHCNAMLYALSTQFQVKVLSALKVKFVYLEL